MKDFRRFLLVGVRPGTDYLFELECLRGLAVFLVFAFHVWGITFGESNAGATLLQSYVAAGRTGVTLFFVLSGFLLSLPWIKWLQGSAERPDIKRYFCARALRILPLYYLAVILAGLMSGNWHGAFNALMFQFVGFDLFPYGVVWWTLTTEVQFYLLLPFFWLGISSPGWKRNLGVALFFLWAGLYAVNFLFDTADPAAKSYWLTKSIFGRLPAFMVGMLCAWVYQHRPKLFVATPSVRYLKTIFFCGLILLLGLVLKRTLDGKEWVIESTWHIHHTYEALIWGGCMLLLIGSGFAGKSLLVNNGAAYLGKISYSVYLNHVPILFFLIYPKKALLGDAIYSETTNAMILPALGFALSVGMATVTYHLIEAPFLNLKPYLRR